MKRASKLPDGHGALHVFRELADAAPAQPFLRIDGEALTRAEFLARVSLWAGALACRGIEEGNFVALISPNSMTLCVAFWAIVSLGAKPVPLDPQIGAWELQNLLSIVPLKAVLAVKRFRASHIAENLVGLTENRAEPPLLVCLEGQAPGMLDVQQILRDAPTLAVPSRAVASNDCLMLACTSGTTGNPKIIAVPHRGFVQAQLDMASELGFCSSDRILLGMPLYHQGGFGMGLQMLCAGGQALYQSQFEPQQFLDALQTERITVAQLSATLAKILLSHPKFDEFDLSHLKITYFAGEVLPDAVAAEFHRKRAIRVINVIGSSETATMVMWDSHRDAARSPSEYLVLPFTEARVGSLASDTAAQPGRLWVSTEALIIEYFGNAEESARRLVEHEGRRWFDTQDLVQRLPDGYVRFVGRLKRIIKRGPNLVHPEELEALLLTHPGVAAVAVVREEHELFGESIAAWIQPAPEGNVTRGELLEFCRNRIAAYKVPDRFIIANELPVDVGKIQYKNLRTEDTQA